MGELHTKDFGVHAQLMEEWNEESKWTWHEAMVYEGIPLTTVVQPFTEWDIRGQGEVMEYVEPNMFTGFMVAVYLTEGEGDLLSLRVYDRKTAGLHDYGAGPKAEKELKELGVRS